MENYSKELQKLGMLSYFKDKRLVEIFDEDRVQDVLNRTFDKPFTKETRELWCRNNFRFNLMYEIKGARYDIEPPTIGTIPKGDGKFREVLINKESDRVLLSLINSWFSEKFDYKLNKNCMSYRRDHNVKQAVIEFNSKLNEYSGGKYGLIGYKVDLSKYFDSVDKQVLLKALDEISDKSSVDYLLYKYYTDDRVVDEKGEMISHFKSIGQGCAFSSFLSNLILKDVDNWLEKNSFFYMRYSDDIIMLGDNPVDLLEKFTEGISKLGLKLNPSKIEEVVVGQWVHYLGFKCNGDFIVLSENKRREFKQGISKITTRSSVRKGSEEQLRKTIRKVLHYVYLDTTRRTKYSWAIYNLEVLSHKEYVTDLDNWIKEKLRASYTGDSCSKSNYRKVSNDKLKELGYISMVQLWGLVRGCPREVFELELKSLMGLS